MGSRQLDIVKGLLVDTLYFKLNVIVSGLDMCDICALAIEKLSKLWRHQADLIRNWLTQIGESQQKYNF